MTKFKIKSHGIKEDTLVKAINQAKKIIELEGGIIEIISPNGYKIKVEKNEDNEN